MSTLRAGLAFLLLTLAPVSAAAGAIFGFDKRPVPDWALEANKTATPDYAKNSEVVILYDEYLLTVDNAGRAVEREREAIRVLKPQGRDHQCGVSYDIDEKLNSFHAWSIDESGKQYQAQPADFVEFGDTAIPILLSTQKSKVLHIPGVNTGTTIVCETEKLMAPYIQEETWHFQEPVPFVYEAMEVDLPAGMAYSSRWHNYTEPKPTETAPNHYRWELRDVEEQDLREVHSRPSSRAIHARMSVRWGESALADKQAQWRAIGQWESRLDEGRATPSPEITAKTQELIAGATDYYSKLKNISTFIQKHIEYFIVERGIGGWQPHPAPAIFQNRYGDCKDKATLMLAMAQAAGIAGNYVVVDTERGIDPDTPSMYGNHMITAIEVPEGLNDPRLTAIVKAANGKRYVIFDPTNQRTPFGNLPTYLQGGYGYMAAGSDSQLLALPTLKPEANQTVETGAFQLALDGSMTGSIHTKHSGPSGAEWRYLLKYTDLKERNEHLESFVARDLPGVTLNGIHFLEPEELDQPLQMRYDITVPRYAHTAGPLLLVRPRVLGDLAQIFDSKPRKVPFLLEDILGDWKDSFDIKLPEGWVVDEVPAPATLDLDFASYHSSITQKDNLLHYEREYRVSAVELPASRAADFNQLQSVILADEKNTVVLRKK